MKTACLLALRFGAPLASFVALSPLYPINHTM